MAALLYLGAGIGIVILSLFMKEDRKNFEKLSGNDLPYVSIHSLRHTNASLMLAGGIPITTAAKRLGHSSPATTGKIYAHALASVDAVAADTISGLLPIKARV